MIGMIVILHSFLETSPEVLRMLRLRCTVDDGLMLHRRQPHEHDYSRLLNPQECDARRRTAIMVHHRGAFSGYGKRCARV